MQIKEIDSLLNKLNRFIEEKTVEHTTVGLCLNLNLPTKSEILQNMFRSWKKYSGSIGFPIPSSDKKLTSHKYYCTREDFYTGEQLDLRVSFAKHICEELKKLKTKIQTFEETV